MERNLLLTICFDGSNYCGWQVQKNGPTVMNELQNAMEKILKERPDVKGCSRTDSKVHAENYCVSFRTNNSIPAQRLVTALNCKLPMDIAALSCCEVESDFHARYSAVGKLYTYRVLNSAVRNPFWEGKSMFCRYPISAESITEEAKPLLGTHDFSSFCNIGGDTLDNIRTIYSFDAKRLGDVVELSVCGDGFLYNMVRIMVGTLVNIETGLRPHGSVKGILESCNRLNAGHTAPASGLYLSRVYYDKDFLKQGCVDFYEQQR